jgi:hypothetical protein
MRSQSLIAALRWANCHRPPSLPLEIRVSPEGTAWERAASISSVIPPKLYQRRPPMPRSAAAF